MYDPIRWHSWHPTHFPSSSEKRSSCYWHLCGLFFFIQRRHTQPLKLERRANCFSYTFLSSFNSSYVSKSDSFFFTFLALFSGDFFFHVNLNFFLRTQQLAQQFLFYPRRTGTGNELSSPIERTKLWLSHLVEGKNFHPSRAETKQKRKLFDSCEITTYFVSCWSWTDLLRSLLLAHSSCARVTDNLSHVLELEIGLERSSGVENAWRETAARPCR